MFAIKSKSLKTELYRKAVHLSSLWMPLLMLLVNRNWCIVVFSVLLVVNYMVELASFYKVPVVGTVFRKLFIKTLRGHEISRDQFVPSGAVYVLAAALSVVVCYNARAAATAMAVMLIADSCAALFGKTFGTYRFLNNKSVEGVLAFFISAMMVIRFSYPSSSEGMILVACVLATAAEFFEKKLKIDDNFSIPLVCGFILNLL